MKDSNYIEVFALDTATMDYFLQLRTAEQIAAEKEAVKVLSAEVINGLHNGLKNLNLWANSDKGTIDEKSGIYTVANRVIQSEHIVKVATPGGSAINTWTTVIKALQNTAHKVRLTICTTVSNDLPSGDRIRQNLAAYGKTEDGRDIVEIYPTLSRSQQAQVQSPSSYIFLQNGKKEVAKCKGFGNKEFITPEHIKQAFAENRYDVVFIPGTAMEKFSPETVECLLEEAIKHNCQIAYALPTELTPENYAFSKKVIENHASFIFGNMEELCAFYSYESKLEGGKDLNANDTDDKVEALLKLECSISKRPEFEPSAFISNGLDGAYIIEPGATRPIRVPLRDETIRPVDNTGAGDAFNAGVLAGIIDGYVKGPALRVPGHIGAAFANAVIQQIGAQLPADIPPQIMQEIISELSDYIEQTLREEMGQIAILLDQNCLRGHEIHL